MGTIVNRSELKAALGVVLQVAELRGSMPILGNVLLEPAFGCCSLVATDLEVGCRLVLAASSSDGLEAFTLPAKKLHELAGKLAGDTVSIQWSSEGFASITSGPTSVKLAGDPAEEYPTLPAPLEGLETVGVPVETVGALCRVSHAMSKDETRYNLNGICIENEAGKARAIATDGHRMAVSEPECSPAWPLGVTETQGVIAERSEVILPGKLVGILAKLSKAKKPADTEWRVACEGSTFCGRFGNLELVARLIEGKFPDYRQIVPKENGASAEFRSKELSGAVERVALLSVERSNAVRFDFSAEGLRVSSSNPDLGEATERVPVVYRGPELSIGFNAKYLREAIKDADAEFAALDMSDASSPLRLFGLEDGRPAPMFEVVMPMRL